MNECASVLHVKGFFYALLESRHLKSVFLEFPFIGTTVSQIQSAMDCVVAFLLGQKPSSIVLVVFISRALIEVN